MMELLGAVATVAVGILAAVQWNISRKTDKRNREVDERYRKAEQDARERERDTEMTRWGGEVIDVMAEIETACAPLSTENKPSIKEIETLSQTASALVDRGRMFFPNVPKVEGAPDDEGIRVRILDQVLRACYIARYLVSKGHADGPNLRHHMWQARRDFVALLQKEMGKSLRKVGADSIGAHVPIDPTSWPEPTKPLKLLR